MWRSKGSGRATRMLLIALLSAFLIGCAGMKPNPKYNRDRPDGKPTQSSGSRKGKAAPKQTTPRSTTPNQAPRGAIGGDALDREVARWWGTPYVLGGGKLQVGVDCSAYVQSAMRAAYGLHLPRTTNEQYRMGRQVDRRSLRRGDLVFFNTSGTGVSHVGIYLGANKFTHASNSDGVTINDLGEKYYSKRYLGARRVK